MGKTHIFFSKIEKNLPSCRHNRGKFSITSQPWRKRLQLQLQRLRRREAGRCGIRGCEWPRPSRGSEQERLRPMLESNNWQIWVDWTRKDWKPTRRFLESQMSGTICPFMTTSRGKILVPCRFPRKPRMLPIFPSPNA